MRYATLAITPQDEALHGADSVLVASDTVDRVAISQITLLNDGTCVLLYRLRGDLEGSRSLLAEHPSIRSLTVSDATDGYAYVHLDPNDTIRELLTLVHNHPFVLRMPIDCLPDGSIRVTLLGTDESIQRAVAAVPEQLSISLERTGDYRRGMEEVGETLTDRQRMVIEAAVERGYYDEPRGTTHSEIADAVGLSVATVGEHLRRAESRIVSTAI